ncbi:Mis12 domain-containing protein [Magnaporthiopsis poae ATCC 64411]|uniref:Mis12 domain-containing protein n=1 Tax=Magnaporthiopsis poae (strain ATCC 64411 / 73-15) TaxID=644358 RepID=A0A0C4EGX7_MAGP6|nr:Mis12 domain-containing protein [Magnaporthiopsis poae ATCC 64411]
MMPDLVQQKQRRGEGDDNDNNEDAAAAARAAGRRAWRTERLGYVEGAARKHLENVRGLDLGPGGEVRDGEWQGEGRSLARGEVEGLEKVVAALGGGAGSTNQAQNPARDGDDDDEMDES